MKKILLTLSTAALILSSCTTAYKTASQRDVTAPVVAAAIADFEVSSEKITYTYIPSRKVRAGGLQNCINTAITKALEKNGGGDILIETQQAIVKRSGLFCRKIKSVTVTGYPATYKNFRNLDERTLKQALINGELKRNVSASEKQGGSIWGFLR